jgi:NodT family efflux transporter outer membrane factor (OMF) lipoprotein
MSACSTLGPRYEKPEVQWLDNWQPDLYGQLSVGNSSRQDLNFWWRMFNDPVLNKLVKITQENNLDLRTAGLRILESRAQLGIAGSSLYPQIQQVQSSITGAQTRRRGGVLPNDDQSVLSYQAGLNLGWELDFWGKFQRSVESADSAFFNSIANYQHMQVLLSSQVINLYYSYRTTEQRIVIANENIKIQKRSFEITERVFLEGQSSELDLQQAKSQYLATLSTIPKLEMSLYKTRNAIATLLARPPGVIPELTTKSMNLPSSQNVMLNDIPANLLLRRPDIRASAWQVAAQSAQIGIAESDFYPSITLLGSLSWSGNSLSSTPDNGILGVGPGVSWNIFDHGRIENNIRVQDARLQQLIEQYQQAVISAAREVDDAAISIVKTSEQIEILKQSLSASQRGLSLANVRYREGYSSFQRVLDAQRAVFSQNEQVVVTRGNHIAGIIALYKSLGGGWTPPVIEEVIPKKVRETMQERSDWGDLITSPLPINNQQTLNNSGATLNE